MADRPVSSQPHGHVPRGSSSQPPGPGVKYSTSSAEHYENPGGYLPPPRPAGGSVSTMGRSRGLSFGDEKDFNNNLGLAIFSAVCCCWPVGILAVMNALEARKQYRMDNMGGAFESAYQARRYTIWSIGIGLGVFIVGIMAVIIVLSYTLK